jgi:serine/threonine protein kinase
MVEGEKCDGESACVGQKLEASSLHETVLCELHIDTERREIPRLEANVVKVGSLLGSGSFSKVFNVSILCPPWEEEKNGDDRTEVPTDDDSSSDPVGSTRSAASYQSNSAHSQVSYIKKYALKTIRDDFEGDRGLTAMAIKDAYFEAEILSYLPSHTHVVNLLAVSSEFWEDPSKGFLVLEKVSETLNHRIARWSRAPTSTTASSSFNALKFWNRRRETLHQQRRRVEVAGLGIAHALKHLHKHSIVYRDLKPANVGFGYDGHIKLFDLGLARTHVPLYEPHRVRRLTGNAGTARYMAPEVALYEDYSFPADVHSYAILLWEICTLEKPYGNISSMDQLKKAAQSQRRPNHRKISSPIIRELLKACWDPDPRVRPTFALIVKQVEIAAGLGEYLSELDSSMNDA